MGGTVVRTWNALPDHSDQPVARGTEETDDNKTLLEWHVPLRASIGPRHAAGSGAPWSTLETKLNKIVTDFDSVGRPLVVVLLELAYQSHLPMGIEYVNVQAAAQPISIHANAETLREVLQIAVTQVPGFRISFESGFVSVYSPQQRQDATDLLNETIPQFSVVGVDTEDAGTELMCALTRTVDPRAGCFSSIAKGQLGPCELHSLRKTCRSAKSLTESWLRTAMPFGR